MKQIAVLLLVILTVFPACGQGEKETVMEENQADPDNGYSVKLPREEWQKILSPEQYQVLCEAGTDRPFTGLYDDFYEKGTYYSAATGQPLFSSEAKFKSGSGWPSFWQPVSENAVTLKVDDSYGMVRTEVLDSLSGMHLGHVFEDGPDPTGLRYCINSTALIFVAEGDPLPEEILRLQKISGIADDTK